MNRQRGALNSYVASVAIALCCLLVSSLEARNVGLFYNETYLDIIDGDLFAEASNLNATLEYLGHNVITFQELSEIQNLEIDLIIIPELEKLSLLNSPGDNQVSYIQSYIESGGGLILMGVVASEEVNQNNAIDLMNYMLGSNITGGEPVLFGTCTKSTILLPGEYTTLPDVIDNNNAIIYLQNGFTEGVKVIYHNTEKLSDVAVAQFPLGKGSMVYFGWGWWNAFPVGSQDGGWLALLDETIETLACSSVTTNFESKYVFSLDDTQSFVLSPDEFSGNVQSCTAVDIQLSKTKFGCDDLGKLQSITVELMNDDGWNESVAIDIEIVDPENYCGVPSQEFTIIGEVQNAEGSPVKDVVLFLRSEAYLEKVVSDEYGQMQSTVSSLETYTAHLDKDLITEAAISARDLRLLSRHLLGIEKFTSPYQYIAADMNGDGFLDVKDQVLMKKALLFELDENEILAPNVQFVAKAYLFRPNVSPLHQNWDTIQGSIIDTDNRVLDVIIIKLGDIDSSIQ